MHGTYSVTFGLQQNIGLIWIHLHLPLYELAISLIFDKWNGRAKHDWRFSYLSDSNLFTATGPLFTKRQYMSQGNLTRSDHYAIHWPSRSSPLEGNGQPPNGPHWVNPRRLMETMQSCCKIYSAFTFVLHCSQPLLLALLSATTLSPE